MPLITWNDQYSVNVQQVDEQHQQLISIVNRLFVAVEFGTAKDVIGGLLKELVDYTVYHFQTEERLFQMYDYPEYEAHRMEHEELTATTAKFIKEFQHGSPLIAIDILNFLNQWLNLHLLGSDKKFGPFLNSKGLH